MSITLEEAKKYLKAEDYSDDDGDIKFYIEVSQIYIDKTVGEEYKTDDKAVKLADLLQRKIIHDMYMNKSIEVPQSTKQDKITLTILDLLSNYNTA